MDENSRQVAALTCKNCSTPLSGHNYCPVCGQKGDTHVLTFRELLEEIADGLFNMDSRLWRSLIPLIAFPGRLTNEFLRGRRMYYLPPFRLYLILSVIFFLIPGNNGNVGDNFGQDFTFDSESFDEEDLSDFSQELERAPLGEDFARQIQEEVTREVETARAANPETYRNTGENCSLDGLPRYSLFTIILRDTCLTFMNDPQRLWQEVFDMVPVMMIVGIPLVALFMSMVYVFSGRYYVEHIIFLLHTHAFFFLVSIAMALSSALGQRYDFLFGVMDWFRIIAGWYIPIYIFLAMLRVYGDSKVKTFFKACFVMTGYGISILIVAVFGILYAAWNA